MSRGTPLNGVEGGAASFGSDSSSSSIGCSSTGGGGASPLQHDLVLAGIKRKAESIILPRTNAYLMK